MRTQSPRRRLGFWMASALVVGNMIGSGVFLLPSSLAEYGPISLIAWVFTSAGAVLLALVFARLARAYPRTGGPYAYARRAFGDFVGFQTAWGYWIAVWAGNAAIAVAFVGYLAHFWHALATERALAAVVGIAVIWLLTAVNAYGVRQGGAVQVVTTVVKLVPLLLIAVGGLFFIKSANFGPFNGSGEGAFSAVTAAAALTLWSFIGLESATVPAEDVENPEKTIPRATIAGTAVTALIYILGTVAVLGLVPAAALAGSTAPFADAADAAFGGWAADLVAAGAAISAFGALNGWILLQGQVPFAAARDGLFPRIFARTGRGGTPVAGLVISSVLVTALMAMNYNASLVDQFTFVILLATLTTVIPYAYAAAAELVLLATDHAAFSGRRLARDAVIALLAFGYSVWAISGAGQEVVFKGTLLVFAGFPVYAWLKYRDARTPLKAVGSEPEPPAKAA
ncbi:MULTISPECIES: amino acid permease [Actinomadura]|uniref:amino acid permease n=1 Tax=unclassified Actinomadura TaxID=2626254 RepID=UPI0033979475